MKPYRSKDSGKTRLTYGSFSWGKSLIRRRQLGEMSSRTSDTQDKDEGGSGVASTLIERVWAWLHDIFPERQIYIRSDGRVQFFTFGPSLQATLAGLSLIFLLWVAFATVNVIFKDRIIAAKDHRYQQMQAAYENRVADLQLSYDELNGALVSAEDRFKSTADELQLKQNTIVKFLDRRRQVDATLAGLANTGVRQGLDTGAADGGGDAVGGPAAPQAAALPVQTQVPGASELSVNPITPPPAPRVGKPGKQSFLDLGGAVSHITGFIFGGRRTVAAHPLSAAALQHPALRELALQTDRLDKIGAGETVLMARAQGEVGEGVNSIRNVIRHTGINPDEYMRQFHSVEAVGGPDLPLADVHIEGIADQAFSDTYLKASAVLEQLNQLLGAIRHIPLTTPVWGSQFERTSGFGARVDPFTGHYSFHPGVDFAGPYGSSIASTAPGTVVFAGQRGGYGNMVEVDHGFGIHTRYGHLSAILVRVGTRVSKGTPIGKLGSTGRSTGPHVHYEVWYDNVVRNPSTFIEAGHHVL